MIIRFVKRLLCDCTKHKQHYNKIGEYHVTTCSNCFRQGIVADWEKDSA